MMLYTLYNGPSILAVSDDLKEIKKIRDGYPALMRGFLSIGKKGIGCTIKMTSDELESDEVPVAEKPKYLLPPIDRPDERFDTSHDLYCLACGERIKNETKNVKYLYIETHDSEGYDKHLPQPRTETMCWDCATEFKRQIQGREWRIIDFMEEKK